MTTYRAIKLRAHIGADRRVELLLPHDLPQGDAEIIVLVADTSAEEAPRRRRLEDFFRDLDASDQDGTWARQSCMRSMRT